MLTACLMFKTPRLKIFKHGVLNIKQAAKLKFLNYSFFFEETRSSNRDLIS
jgi:hypothetical protein